MDVDQLLGGGPQIDPANDALIAAVHDVAAAGVVPVIAAGNDRDDFGAGSAGSPGTAPDAISVAAVSNTHVFAPALDVTAAGAPGFLHGIPFHGREQRARAGVAGERRPDARRRRRDHRHRRKLVERHLCGPPGDLDRARHAAARLALRRDRTGRPRAVPVPGEGRAGARAGATGIVFADNREGEANGCRSRRPCRADRSRTSTPRGCATTWPRTAAARRSASAATSSSSRPDAAA